MLDYIVEKIMEQGESIYRSFTRKEITRSNLVETYTIIESESTKEYVQNFLKERARIAKLNRYGIAIYISNASNETNQSEIGKVQLCRMGKCIDEAQLITKDNENDKEKIIYWKFKK